MSLSELPGLLCLPQSKSPLHNETTTQHMWLLYLDCLSVTFSFSSSSLYCWGRDSPEGWNHLQRGQGGDVPWWNVGYNLWQWVGKCWRSSGLQTTRTFLIRCVHCTCTVCTQAWKGPFLPLTSVMCIIVNILHFWNSNSQSKLTNGWVQFESWTCVKDDCKGSYMKFEGWKPDTTGDMVCLMLAWAESNLHRKKNTW